MCRALYHNHMAGCNLAQHTQYTIRHAEAVTVVHAESYHTDRPTIGEATGVQLLNVSSACHSRVGLNRRKKLGDRPGQMGGQHIASNLLNRNS